MLSPAHLRPEPTPSFKADPVPSRVPSALNSAAPRTAASGLNGRTEPEPMRRLAFWAAVAMIFVRFSVLPELLVSILHVNTYLLYIVGPPAILGCIITGGLGRAARFKPVWLWTGFFFCMVLATPFSSWVGASAQKVISYGRTDLICLFIIAGLVVTWKEVTTVFNTLACSGFVLLIATRMFAKPDGNGRLWLDLGADGTISNSNDLAAHLLLLLPFVLYFGMKPGRNTLLRLASFGGVFYGLWVILGTSSRGAMLGLFAMSLLLFFRASGAQKAVVLVLVPILALGLVAVLPKQNLARLATVFGGASESTGPDDEAADSMESRQYLLRQSIKYTLEHPVFGVGPSQFSNFEGIMARAQGQHGNWHETHNTYTQISSECGIPALLFALAALVGAFRMVNGSYKAAIKAGNRIVAQTCLWYLTSFAGYLVCLMFLAGGYRFTFPAMIGLAMAVHRGAQRELATGNLDPLGAS